MESVSWTDTGDTNVNVSVVTPEVDVKVSLVFMRKKQYYITSISNLNICTELYELKKYVYTLMWFFAKTNVISFLVKRSSI